MNSVEEDESKRSLKYVQDRLKYLKLETAPKEVLYAVRVSET